jgi:hypothetical protein
MLELGGTLALTPSECIVGLRAHFTQGVKALVQRKSSIPIGAKVETSLSRALHTTYESRLK